MERNARDGFWWSVGSVLTVSFVMLWIAFTPDGTAIVSVSWVWPTAAILHVLGLIALIALRIVIDLRLTTRALDAMPVPELVRRLTPVTVVAAAFTIVSGLVLYMMGDSARFAANPMFQAKLVMLAGALATLWYMHAVILRSAHHWDSAAAPPRHARLAGFVSLTLWAFVVVFSMLTPYAY